MLTSALLLMFAAADVQPAFLSTTAPRAIRLVSVENTPQPYKGWSVTQLRTEYDRIDDQRPGSTLPITSILTGITGMATSLIAYAIALGNFRGADSTANIAFGIGGTVSVALVALGAIQLWRTATERRTTGVELDTLQRLADGQERDERLLDIWERRHGPSAPPPLLGAPPVGPVPPPTAPPIVPGPPIIPGQVSLVIPLFFARF